METSKAKDEGNALLSDLYRIEVPEPEDASPFTLFRVWLEEARASDVLLPTIAVFATSDGCGRVSARSLLLRHLDPDGFVFMTDARSKKIFDVERSPHAAVTFVWTAASKAGGFLSRQVRIEGYVTIEPMSKYEQLYATEPLYCKIRANLCRQGEFVKWEEHKKVHDQIFLEKAEQIASEPPPEHYTALKMHPEMMEFYSATDKSTGDRVVFRVADATSLIPPAALQNQEPDVREELVDTKTTFNNGRRITMGSDGITPPSDCTKWVYYHIAA